MKKLTLHQIVWYFIIFSIIGMFMENIFCYVGSGIIDSRMGFIIGPFCPIYGIGAIFLIVCLYNQKNKWYKLFFLGAILGSAFEYFSSYFLEALYGIKFWDYKNLFLNINGRTSIRYAFFWGILTVLLIYYMKPKVDTFIKKYQSKSLDYIILFFMIFNGLATYKAIDSYVYRAKGVLGIAEVKKEDNFEKLMSNEVMKFVFPNMVYVINEKQEIWLKNIM